MEFDITFLGKVGSDGGLMGVAGAFEEVIKRRTSPKLTPDLGYVVKGSKMTARVVEGKVVGTGRPEVWVSGVNADLKRDGDGDEFEVVVGERGEMPEGRTAVGKDVVLRVGSKEDGHTDAEFLLI
jgi:hypothetical protein